MSANQSSEFAGTSLALTAGIYYTNPDVRFETSLEFAERARDAGVPAVFVNGSPEDKQGTWVSDAHRARGAIVLPAEIPGIATQRKQGVKFLVDRGAEKIVGVESEKPLIPTFAPELSAALDHNDVLVVGRTPEALASMPPVQKRAEHLAGWILEQVHGLPPDTLAGPRGFTVAGAEVLAQYPATESGKNNWLYLYDTPLNARRAGLRVGGIALGFTYPEGMVREETGNPTFDGKRYDQFEMQLRYLLDPGQLTDLGPLDERRLMAAFVRQTLKGFDGASLEQKAALIDKISADFAQFDGYRPPKR